MNTKNDSYPRPTFEQIRALVVQWFRDRRIVPNSTAAAQTLKAVSEMGELADAVLKGERGKIVDGVGDVRWVIRERDEARAEMERLSIQLADWELLGDRLKEAMNIASQKSKTRNDAFDELSKQRDESRSEAARGDVAKALLAQIDDALNAAGVPTLHPDTGAAERKPMLLRERVEWLAGNKNEARSEVEKLKAELRTAEGEWKHWKRIADHRKEKISAMVARPEPSRLEIAALFYSSGLGPVHDALKRADALIAAAKEEPSKEK